MGSRWTEGLFPGDSQRVFAGYSAWWSCVAVASFLQASICRSSQPLSGFSARCMEDEQMLQAIRKANPGSDFIYVVDTRPKVSVTILMHVMKLKSGQNLIDPLTCSHYFTWKGDVLPAWSVPGSPAGCFLEGLSSQRSWLCPVHFMFLCP
jgi:hypothetical protein